MMKGGLGSASTQLSDGTLVGALVVVNALGDVIDPQTRQVVAGTRHPSGQGFLATNPFGNTTIAVVATNASLTKAQVNKTPQMAHHSKPPATPPPHPTLIAHPTFPPPL